MNGDWSDKATVDEWVSSGLKWSSLERYTHTYRMGNKDWVHAALRLMHCPQKYLQEHSETHKNRAVKAIN